MKSIQITTLLILVISYPLVVVKGEIKTFVKNPLPATSSYIQYSTGYLVDPGYVDLTNVKFIADGNEWSLNPQDRYDNDDDGVLEADDNFSDQGTPFPTGSPTAFVTALVTDKATDGSTMEGTTNVTDGSTMEGTSEATDGFTMEGTSIATDGSTMEGTSEATDGFTMEGTSNATAEDTENTVIDDEYDDMKGNISPTPSPTAQVEKVSYPTTTKDAKNGDDDYYYGNRRYLSADDTVIDVIFFHEPGECVKTKAGCDWAKLGVGSSDNAGNNRWCCSEDAIDLGLCEEQNLGRIIINKALFRGEHRPVTIPPVGSYEASMKLPVLDTKEGTGQYTLVLANCNDYGRDVYVDGQYLWRSKGGYLPGNLFEEWHFITFLTIGYGALLFWYGRSMYQNKDSMIGIQKWILGTVTLALIELIFKGIDYMEWNQQGMRINFVMYFWITLGVLKGAISRCLLVMVCLGWGVIRDTLGDQMKKIILLGVLYSVFAFARDAAEIIFVEELQVLSYEEEKNIYDVFTILTFATAAVDVIFYMWILDSLNSTMQYLENMNQNMKLRRYLRLRLILLFSILFAICWSVFGIVDATMNDSILGEGKEWLVQSMWDINYTFVLVSIALLWKPDPRAKEFAYVMELPSIGGDMVLETSIGSPDDEDEDGVNIQYSDVMTGQDRRFTIDDAVPS